MKTQTITIAACIACALLAVGLFIRLGPRRPLPRRKQTFRDESSIGSKALEEYALEATEAPESQPEVDCDRPLALDQPTHEEFSLRTTPPLVDETGHSTRCLRSDKIACDPRPLTRLRQVLEIVDANDDIRAVTFDMFGTLVQWTSSLEARHAVMWDKASTLLRKHGLDAPVAEVRYVRNRVWYPHKMAENSRGREVKVAHVLRETVQEIARRKNSPLPSGLMAVIVSELEEMIIATDIETLIPISEASGVLSLIRATGRRLGLISNYPYKQEAVHRALERAGLALYFDIILVSSSVGYIKSDLDPASVIFRRACVALGVPPSSMLHVGDDLIADYRAPRRFGMNALLCVNHELWRITRPSLTHDCDSLRETPQEIKAFAAEARRECIRKCQIRQDLGSQDTTQAAIRLYEISRDIVAPVIIRFAEASLGRASANPGSLNLCVGRDGLTSFIIQQKLLELFPERYSSIRRKDIRYLSLSRRLVVESSDDVLRAFLQSRGISQYREITLVDFGLTGTVQNRLQLLYPTKQIYGHYLMAHRLSWDVYRGNKEGFLVQTDGVTPGAACNELNITGGSVGTELAQIFLSLEFIHFFEDLWNGIYESSGPLVRASGYVRPINEAERIPVSPGIPGVIPFLWGAYTYEGLKKIALRGIVEGVLIYKMQTERGLAPALQESIGRLAKWFLQASITETLDNDLIRALARACPDPKTQGIKWIAMNPQAGSLTKGGYAHAFQAYSPYWRFNY